MENSYHLDLICYDFINNCERETANNRASEISIDNWIQVWIANNSQQSVVDTFHEFDVQILALVGVPLTGLGEFSVRVGSEPNDHLRLARLHEFSSDFVPCAALPGITSGRLQPSIEFSLLRVG